MKDDAIADLTKGLSFELHQVYMMNNQMKSQNRLFHSIKKSFSQKICVNTLLFTWLNSASGVDTIFYFG